MSYAYINGMRSARYPLQGDCGCGCEGAGTCGGGMGSIKDKPWLAPLAIGTVAVGLIWGMSRSAGRSPVRRNRRRRRRR